MTEITLPVNALRAALTHAADKDVRYYLIGVYVDTAKGKIVATDGHRLFICDGPRADCAPFILPRADVERVLKSLPSEYGRGKPMACAELPVTVQATDGKVWITMEGGNGAKFTFSAIDGTFPDYARVIPQTVRDASFAVLDWEYAHAACEAIAIYRDVPKSKHKNCQVGIWTAGDNVALVSDGQPGALALIMPQRCDIKSGQSFADSLDWVHA